MAGLAPGRLLVSFQLNPGRGGLAVFTISYIDGLLCRPLEGPALGLPSSGELGYAHAVSDSLVALRRYGDRETSFYRLEGGRFARVGGTARDVARFLKPVGWREGSPIACVRDGVFDWYDKNGNFLGESPGFGSLGEIPGFGSLGDLRLLGTPFPSLPSEIGGLRFQGVGDLWAFSGPGEDCVCWMRAADVRALLADEWAPRDKPVTARVRIQAGDVVLSIEPIVSDEGGRCLCSAAAEGGCSGYTVVSGVTKKCLYSITDSFLAESAAAAHMKSHSLEHFGPYWWVLGHGGGLSWALGGVHRGGKAYAQKFCTVFSTPKFAFGGRVLVASPAEGEHDISHALPGGLEHLEVDAAGAALEFVAAVEAPGAEEADGREPLPLRVLRCFIREDAEAILFRALQSADF